MNHARTRPWDPAKSVSHQGRSNRRRIISSLLSTSHVNIYFMMATQRIPFLLFPSSIWDCVLTNLFHPIYFPPKRCGFSFLVSLLTFAYTAMYCSSLLAARTSRYFRKGTCCQDEYHGARLQCYREARLSWVSIYHSSWVSKI